MTGCFSLKVSTHLFHFAGDIQAYKEKLNAVVEIQQ